jgi:hypothetical protein
MKELERLGRRVTHWNERKIAKAFKGTKERKCEGLDLVGKKITGFSKKE